MTFQSLHKIRKQACLKVCYSVTVIFVSFERDDTILVAFDNQENAYYSSRFKSPAGIDRDAMRFQGLGAILLWLAHLASISHDKPRHCAAVTRSNAPSQYLIITSIKAFTRLKNDLRTSCSNFTCIK